MLVSWPRSLLRQTRPPTLFAILGLLLVMVLAGAIPTTSGATLAHLPQEGVTPTASSGAAEARLGQGGGESSELSQVMVPTGTRELPNANAVLKEAYGPSDADVPLATRSPAGPAHGAPAVGMQWNQLTTNTPPSARAGAAMAYDAADGYVVLFGGESSSGGNVYYLGDTWTYVGGVWTNITSSLSQSPSPRYGALMTYDAADQELVLLGGYTVTSGTNFVNDTWTFSHGAWSRSTQFPVGIWMDAELTYDATNGYVLFAGITLSTPQNYGQTWSFRDGDWKLLSDSDPGLQWDPLTFDSADSYVLQLGGNNSYVTYSWNKTWNNVGASDEPPLNGWQPIVDDPPLNVVLFPEMTDWNSHQYGMFLTWTYAGATWTNITSSIATPPPMRQGASLAFDGADNYVLLFGGATSSTYFDDSWTFTSTAVAQLQVHASASPTIGRNPLPVQFDAWATGGSGPISYAWRASNSSGNDGPGGFSDAWGGSGPAPQHTFPTLGTFIVHVWANDSVGDSSITTLTVIVNPMTIVAVAAATPTSGSAPLQVVFNGTASGGLPPFSWSWTFGDGGTSTLENPSHTYTQDGLYQVVLNVTDTGGNYATSTLWITVGFSATIQASPTSGFGPLDVDFTSTVSGGTAPYTYAWNFGDGSTSTAANPSHTFASGGKYGVVLNVTDSAASTASTAILWITVYSPSFSVQARAAPTSGVVPLDVLFNATASGGVSPISWRWNCSTTGWLSNAENPSHTFNQSGSYLVWLEATDSVGDLASTTLWITVSNTNSTLVASANANQTSGPAPLSVQFTGSASGGSGSYVSYQWSLGDGSESNDQDPVHTYENAGVYHVTLNVTDSRGAYATAALTVTATSGGNPLTVDPYTGGGTTTGPAPLNISFFANPSGGSGGYTGIWEFGDGTAPQAALDIAHTYQAAGVYTASIYVTDSAGATANATVTITVTSGCSTCSLGLTVVARPTTVDMGDPVTFWANASGGAPSYSATWGFGDGSNASGTIAIHSYSAAGVYTAVVDVFDTAGHEVVGSVQVTVVACSGSCGAEPLAISLSSVPTSGSVPLKDSLLAEVSGGTAPYTLTFCFGDGTPCLAVDSASEGQVAAAHTYTGVGTYTASVSVLDTAGGEASASTRVNVTGTTPLTVSAAEAPTNGAAPLNVSFSWSIAGGSAPYTVQWSFGDGDYGSGVPGSSTFHIYQDSGYFVPILEVTDSAGASVNYTLATIHVSVPPAKPTGLSAGSTATLVGLGVGAMMVGAVSVAIMFRMRKNRQQDLRNEGNQLVEAMRQDPQPASPPPPPLENIRRF